MCFDILNRLDVTQKCDGQTDGQKDGSIGVPGGAPAERELNKKLEA